MMHILSKAALAVCLFTAPAAFAQTAAPSSPPARTGSTDGPGNSAVKDPQAKPVATPVEGANSFTEAQARSRIEGQGFTSVTGLTKGDDGVWRGKATKGGSTADVALDFKGNVTSK
jgi:hypothetical protein